MEIGTILIYMAKVAVILALFYLFNRLLLSRETFYRANRVWWLVSIAGAFVLPFVAFSVDNQSVAMEMIEVNTVVDTNQIQLFDILTVEQTVDQTTQIVQTTTTEVVVNVLFWVYLVGVAGVVGWFLMVHSSLLRFLFTKKYRTASMDESAEIERLIATCKESLGIKRAIHYRLHDKDLSPFSWMNYIVISRSDLHTLGREIILHEMAHIKSRHSWDILLLNMVIALQWFNPAIWLSKSSMQQLHEYWADEMVLQGGINAKEYQLLLIKKAVGSRLYSIANSLNHSNLKKRITMMLKKKSNRMSTLKYLYALPVALGAVVLLSSEAIARHTDPISRVKVIENLDNFPTEGQEILQDFHQTAPATDVATPNAVAPEALTAEVMAPDSTDNYQVIYPQIEVTTRNLEPELVTITTQGKDIFLQDDKGEKMEIFIDGVKVTAEDRAKVKDALENKEGLIVTGMPDQKAPVVYFKTDKPTGVRSMVNYNIPKGMYINIDGKDADLETLSKIHPSQIASTNMIGDNENGIKTGFYVTTKQAAQNSPKVTTNAYPSGRITPLEGADDVDVYLNGVKVDKNVLSSINPDIIKSQTIIKDDKNGIKKGIYISLYDTDYYVDGKLVDQETALALDPKTATLTTVIDGRDGKNNQYHITTTSVEIFIDGKLTDVKFADIFTIIKHEDMKSMTVVANQHGVRNRVEVTTRSQKEKAPSAIIGGAVFKASVRDILKMENTKLILSGEEVSKKQLESLGENTILHYNKETLANESNTTLFMYLSPEYYVDGKLTNESELKKINPQDIENTAIIKGKEGKNPKIIITLKQGNAPSINIGGGIAFKSSVKELLKMKDARFFYGNKEVSMDELKSLDRDLILSCGKNDKASTDINIYLVEHYIDGKLAEESELKNLDPNDIEKQIVEKGDGLSNPSKIFLILKK